MKRHISRPAPALFAALLALALTALPVPRGAAAAELGASPWVVTDHARIRLVPGPRAADGSRLAGIHIELEPGWHTYWRNPGASGVPPRFDWAASANLAAAEPLWPAPRRLRDEYGVSYGYLDEVVFPLRLSPEEADAGVSLRLTVDYAVCAEICIPLTDELSLELPAAAPARPVFARLVERFVEAVPKAQAPGALPRVEEVTVATHEGRPALLVTAALADAAGRAELFVEGPDRYYLTVPDAPQAAGGPRGRYLVDVSGASSEAELRGIRLRTTLVTDGAAVEAWWTLD